MWSRKILELRPGGSGQEKYDLEFAPGSPHQLISNIFVSLYSEFKFPLELIVRVDIQYEVITIARSHDKFTQ